MFPLPHQSDSRIADLRHPDRVLFFKICPDLLKILAIHEQGFVGLPHPFSQMALCSMHIYFPAYSARTSAKCMDVFLLYPVPSKSTLPLSA